MDPSRRSGEEEESTTRPFNPPSIFRDSAFSRPILPASSSLLPPKPLQPGPSNGSAEPGPVSAFTDAGPDRYRECLRNHAASLGGHVVDGCGEFMPAAPAEPLKCAACGCHRSFHRREPEPDASNPRTAGRPAVQLLLAAPPPQRGGGGFGCSTACTESSSEERNNPLVDPGEGKKKKRFRTKFSSEQKEKMAGFAQRVGWRVQKKDEAEMERFCREVGVSRQVLKVWMHNNKHLFKKPPPPPQQNPHDLQPHHPQLQPQSEPESHGEKKGLMS